MNYLGGSGDLVHNQALQLLGLRDEISCDRIGGGIAERILQIAVKLMLEHILSIF